MNKQELIKEFREIGIYNLSIFGTEIKGIPTESAITLIEQLDEPEKVKVPQFVADWIEEARKACKDVVDFFEFNFTNDEVGKWFMQELPFDLAARAWLDGYEVEKEKRYLVTLKNRQPLVKSQSGSTLYFSQDITARNYKGTQKELEDAKFGWVFDCPGIEIEEVE
ncbi:phage protein [Streptococcus pneumoniae]|nr:phage protein [Streptococcus pneumoniae]